MFSGVLMGLGYFFQVKGGRKISDKSFGGAKNFRTLIFSESFGRVKGHVKNLFRKYGVLRES